MRIPRQAARVAVLDPTGAIFLLRSDNEEVGVHWLMPGGGLDPGETPVQGALREVLEETGWSDVEPGAVLCTWEHDFTRAGVPVRQFEHIFLGSGPRRPPAGDVSGVHQEDGILEWRWWTPEHLARTTEALWPPQLPELLTRLRDEGPPERPVELGFIANAATRGA